MVLAPFNNKQTQKTASIMLMIFGLLLIMVTAPFSVQIGGYVIVSTVFGGIMAVTGLIYFVDVTA